MKILFPLHNNVFNSLQEDEKKEEEKAGKEMLYEILYMENSGKARFSDLKKSVENYYVPNKAEFPRTVTAVQSLLLNYQPYYNSDRNSQLNRARNQIIFVQRGKTGDDEGNGKDKDQRPRRNMDHITCNDCG